MSDSGNRGDRTERRDGMAHGSKVRSALEKAIKRAGERSAQASTSGTVESSSKAEAAIRKLRQNERLSREELDTPVTI